MAASAEASTTIRQELHRIPEKPTKVVGVPESGGAGGVKGCGEISLPRFPAGPARLSTLLTLRSFQSPQLFCYYSLISRFSADDDKQDLTFRFFYF